MNINCGCCSLKPEGPNVRNEPAFADRLLILWGSLQESYIEQKSSRKTEHTAGKDFSTAPLSPILG